MSVRCERGSTEAVSVICHRPCLGRCPGVCRKCGEHLAMSWDANALGVPFSVKCESCEQGKTVKS